MRQFVAGFAVGLVAAAVVALAQPGIPNWPIGSTEGEKHRAREYNTDGDHVAENLKGLSGTPTPALPDRCFSYCDAATGQLKMSFDGGAFQPYGGTGGCACPGAGTDSTCVGPSASCAGIDSTCIGEACTVQDAGTCVGKACSAGEDAVGVGVGVTAGNNCTAIGSGTACDGNGNIVLGRGTSSGATNFNLFVGSDITAAAPLAISYQPPRGLGTNVAGALNEIRGGRSTGSGVGGDILFSTVPAGGAGSSANPITQRWTIDAASGSFIPVTNNTVHVGSTAKRVAIVHTNAIADNSGQWDLGSGHITPTVNGAQNIGENLLRVLNIYATELTLSGVTGTGKAVCVKSDGFLGVCADAPNGSGVCTCG